MEKKEIKTPDICICLTGKTIKSNYQKLLKILLTKEVDNVDDFDIDSFKTSMNYFEFPKSIKKDDEKEWKVDIWIFDIRENIDKSLIWLKENKKKDKDNKLKVINDYIETIEHAIENNRISENKCVFHIEIHLKPKKELSMKSLETGDFIDKYNKMNDILKVFNDIKMDVSGFACNDLIFNSEKYELIVPIQLPFNICDIPDLQKLPLASKLIEEMGKPKLENIGFSFDDSPIGLKKMIIANDGKFYILMIRINYKTDNLKNLIKSNYIQTMNIAKLIIREV